MTDILPLWRAFLRGGLVASVCAILGLAVRYILAFEGELPVAVTWVILGAVIGSTILTAGEGRGGKTYAAMAVILTYLSMGAYQTGVVLLAQPAPKPNFSETDTSNPLTTLKAIARRTTHPKHTQSHPDSSAATSSDDPPFEKVWVGFLIFSYLGSISICMPIVAGLKTPILLPILGLALYSAWRISNRTVSFQGPFPLNIQEAALPSD